MSLLINSSTRNKAGGGKETNEGAAGGVEKLLRGLTKKKDSSSSSGGSTKGPGIVKALDFHKAMKDAGIKYGTQESDQLMLNISVRKDGRIDVSNLVKSQSKRPSGTSTSIYQPSQQSKVKSVKSDKPKSGNLESLGLGTNKNNETTNAVDPKSPMSSMAMVNDNVMEQGLIGKTSGHSSAFSQTGKMQAKQSQGRGKQSSGEKSPPPLVAQDSIIFDTRDDIKMNGNQPNPDRPTSGPSLAGSGGEKKAFMRVASPVTLEDTREGRRNSTASLSLNLFRVNRRSASISSARSTRSAMSTSSMGSSGERFSPSKSFSMEDRRPSTPRKNVAFDRRSSRGGSISGSPRPMGRRDSVSSIMSGGGGALERPNSAMDARAMALNAVNESQIFGGGNGNNTQSHDQPKGSVGKAKKPERVQPVQSRDLVALEKSAIAASFADADRMKLKMMIHQRRDQEGHDPITWTKGEEEKKGGLKMVAGRGTQSTVDVSWDGKPRSSKADTSAIGPGTIKKRYEWPRESLSLYFDSDGGFIDPVVSTKNMVKEVKEDDRMSVASSVASTEVKEDATRQVRKEVHELARQMDKGNLSGSDFLKQVSKLGLETNRKLVNTVEKFERQSLKTSQFVRMATDQGLYGDNQPFVPQPVKIVDQVHDQRIADDATEFERSKQRHHGSALKTTRNGTWMTWDGVSEQERLQEILPPATITPRNDHFDSNGVFESYHQQWTGDESEIQPTTGRRHGTNLVSTLKQVLEMEGQETGQPDEELSWTNSMSESKQNLLKSNLWFEEEKNEGEIESNYQEGRKSTHHERELNGVVSDLLKDAETVEFDAERSEQKWQEAIELANQDLQYWSAGDIIAWRPERTLEDRPKVGEFLARDHMELQGEARSSLKHNFGDTGFADVLGWSEGDQPLFDHGKKHFQHNQLEETMMDSGRTGVSATSHSNILDWSEGGHESMVQAKIFEYSEEGSTIRKKRQAEERGVSLKPTQVSMKAQVSSEYVGRGNFSSMQRSTLDSKYSAKEKTSPNGRKRVVSGVEWNSSDEMKNSLRGKWKGEAKEKRRTGETNDRRRRERDQQASTLQLAWG